MKNALMPLLERIPLHKRPLIKTVNVSSKPSAIAIKELVRTWGAGGQPLGGGAAPTLTHTQCPN
jgi:hypothetical protein